jgi:hypothetical protein
MWRLSGSGAFLSWQLSFLAQGLAARGAHEEALAEARAALEHCERTGEAYGASDALRVIGLVLAAADNPNGNWDAAVAAYRHALERAHQQGAHWLALRAAFTFARSASTGGVAASIGALARDALAQELRWFDETQEGLETPLVTASRGLLASSSPAPAAAP